ncbi:MAG: LLM class flavin-dependent oxidoreductase [Rhodospirillaceae bacterium]|jgi:alkanesulfonate monooxygenase SsuD/methylene tetrahydromethanopterin reductase-like flavin-dependent oxidoreductase (luciferase family)|nr:LLM class flavin-dependent oxidoreductase [Rhodospirillaceae bacterium]MBT4486972.1 LLM class flavin-dependent oxidoreductase [Rhodospirillaceae bacterium]MBT5191792.1 LLM class flavin-dependent oxidoreductase [Rhodospirillaceae bacterium]MBT5894477.1 LLM class flavin-dependent oxidoreductase [Rhodospirillaceae bacterium]MBT6431195.1 LLM class flavin-dependent oxidoreductase [Rhodospirillaceae bacterium]
MRIGMFTASQWGADEGPKTVLASLRQQVRTARDNGFSSLLLGQHVVSGPMGMFQTIPLMGQLADDAAGMQIGPGVLLLSMMNPILAAEEAATIDWLCDGNYVLAAGLGYREEEFQAMGVDIGNRVGRLTEGLELIKRLWTEDVVNHEGRYFKLTDARPGVRPKQQPRPPIWLGGDVEPAVRRAARLADAWLAAPTTAFDVVTSFIAAFREERDSLGLATDVKCPIVRECFIGRNAAHAREVSRAPLLAKYAAYASWGQEGAASADFETAFDEFAASRFLIGDAVEVRDQLQEFAETTGSDHFLMRMQWPGLDQGEALANIERIGKLI